MLVSHRYSSLVCSFDWFLHFVGCSSFGFAEICWSYHDLCRHRGAAREWTASLSLLPVWYSFVLVLVRSVDKSFSWSRFGLVLLIRWIDCSVVFIFVVCFRCLVLAEIGCSPGFVIRSSNRSRVDSLFLLTARMIQFRSFLGFVLHLPIWLRCVSAWFGLFLIGLVGF